MGGAPETARSRKEAPARKNEAEANAMLFQLIAFIYPKWFKWVFFGGGKPSAGLSPSLNIWDTRWKVRSNSCKEMIAGMSELATTGGLGWRPTMTHEQIKSSKMIHEVSWNFQALLEREKERSSSTSLKNLQTNSPTVSLFPSLATGLENVTSSYNMNILSLMSAAF